MKGLKVWMSGSVLAVASTIACSPATQFKAANLGDASAEVKTKSAGMNTSPDGRSGSQAGRVNIDCFADSVSAGAQDEVKSVGIPSNCPSTGNGSVGSSSVRKADIAVVLDTSENMLDSGKAVKKELAIALKKLLAEERIGSLAAFAFRTAVTETEKSTDFAKSIDLITSEDPKWSANGLKVIDPNDTKWVTNEAAKAVFPALREAVGALQAGSQADKILILLTGSTGSGASGFDIGPAAKLVSDLASAVAAKSGQFTFNYAAAETLAQGLSEYAPTPLKQLDLLSSAAAISPVRSNLNSSLGGWGEKVVVRASTPVSSSESCLLVRLEGFDSADAPVFKKELPVSDKSGFQDASLPKVLIGIDFKLKVVRKCEKSGEVVQTVFVKAGKESGRK